MTLTLFCAYCGKPFEKERGQVNTQRRAVGPDVPFFCTQACCGARRRLNKPTAQKVAEKAALHPRKSRPCAIVPMTPSLNPMNDEKKISEREAVKRERAAFFMGRQTYGSTPDPHNDWRRDAAKRYPSPKVTLPRVVTSDVTGRSYSLWPNGDGIVVTVKGSGINLRLHDAGCQVEAVPLIDVPLVAKLLLDGPTELRDDDD